MILAAGAGANQCRLFDYETGKLICIISEMPKPILSICLAHNNSDFALGSVDSAIRVMSLKGGQ